MAGLQLTEYGILETIATVDEYGKIVFNYVDEYGRRKRYLEPGEGRVLKFNKREYETRILSRGYRIIPAIRKYEARFTV